VSRHPAGSFGAPVRGACAILLLATGALLSAGAGGSAPQLHTETRLLMGTVVKVSLWGGGDPARASLARAFEAMEAVDREMGRRPGTALWELNRAGKGTLSGPMAAVLEASLRWARKSGGAFDPTVAPLMDLWDIPSGPHPPPQEAALALAVARVGWGRVRWEAKERRVNLGGSELDFGGIAKGYAVDQAVKALRSAGASDFIVDAGGDLFVAGARGERPWKVGIQDPRAPDQLLRVVEPREGAFVTSGDYENAFFWEGRRIHHIMDPHRGHPAAGCQSVTVWALSATDAVALAKAAFVLGPTEGLSFLESEGDAEGLIVDAQGRVLETSGFSRVAPTAGADR